MVCEWCGGGLSKDPRKCYVCGFKYCEACAKVIVHTPGICQTREKVPDLRGGIMT